MSGARAPSDRCSSRRFGTCPPWQPFEQQDHDGPVRIVVEKSGVRYQRGAPDTWLKM